MGNSNCGRGDICSRSTAFFCGQSGKVQVKTATNHRTFLENQKKTQPKWLVLEWVTVCGQETIQTYYQHQGQLSLPYLPGR